MPSNTSKSETLIPTLKMSNSHSNLQIFKCAFSWFSKVRRRNSINCRWKGCQIPESLPLSELIPWGLDEKFGQIGPTIMTILDFFCWNISVGFWDHLLSWCGWFGSHFYVCVTFCKVRHVDSIAKHPLVVGHLIVDQGWTYTSLSSRVSLISLYHIHPWDLVVNLSADVRLVFYFIFSKPNY